MAKKFVMTDTGYILVKERNVPKHFFLMGKRQRKLVANWCKRKKGRTQSQKEFLRRVRDAIELVTYDYRIATIEPSQDENGKICYKVGETVLKDLSFDEWLVKAKEFMPECGSDLANLPELDLWYAYRIARGYWTIAYVCDDSSRAGNYWNSPRATRWYDPSGAKRVGGFADGVGNTWKIVKDVRSGFWQCGGAAICDYGEASPVANSVYNEDTRFGTSGCGWVVLRG